MKTLGPRVAVRGRALCIFKAVTKKKGILLFLREGNRCSYSLEKCWGPCNLAESCRESCSTRLARLIPPTPRRRYGNPTLKHHHHISALSFSVESLYTSTGTKSPVQSNPRATGLPVVLLYPAIAQKSSTPRGEGGGEYCL